MPSTAGYRPDPQIPALIKAVDNLKASIEHADKQSHTLNRSIFWLAVITGALTAVQVIVAVLAFR